MFPLKKEGSRGERWHVFLCWPLGGSISPDQLDDSGQVVDRYLWFLCTVYSQIRCSYQDCLLPSIPFNWHFIRVKGSKFLFIS